MSSNVVVVVIVSDEVLSTRYGPGAIPDSFHIDEKFRKCLVQSRY